MHALSFCQLYVQLPVNRQLFSESILPNQNFANCNFIADRLILVSPIFVVIQYRRYYIPWYIISDISPYHIHVRVMSIRLIVGQMVQYHIVFFLYCTEKFDEVQALKTELAKKTAC